MSCVLSACHTSRPAQYARSASPDPEPTEPKLGQNEHCSDLAAGRRRARSMQPGLIPEAHLTAMLMRPRYAVLWPFLAPRRHTHIHQRTARADCGSVGHLSRLEQPLRYSSRASKCSSDRWPRSVQPRRASGVDQYRANRDMPDPSDPFCIATTARAYVLARLRDFITIAGQE
jgi:hypothetical protein